MIDPGFPIEIMAGWGICAMTRERTETMKKIALISLSTLLATALSGIPALADDETATTEEPATSAVKEEKKTEKKAEKKEQEPKKSKTKIEVKTDKPEKTAEDKTTQSKSKKSSKKKEEKAQKEAKPE